MHTRVCIVIFYKISCDFIEFEAFPDANGLFDTVDLVVLYAGLTMSNLWHFLTRMGFLVSGRWADFTIKTRLKVAQEESSGCGSWTGTSNKEVLALG